MQSDLAGRIRNTRLAVSNALLPLFEAIVNAADAIQESARTDGRIEIRILRGQSLFSGSESGPEGMADIVDLEVSDNGIGFTERNYSSFSTLDSLTKEDVGGKGVGRLVWLVAFESVSITSTYSNGQQWYERRFDFCRSSEGVERMTNTALESSRDNTSTTTVYLKGFKNAYRDAAPKTARAIAKRVIEHCLVPYMLGTMPRVFIYDAAEPGLLDLTGIYDDEFKKSSASRVFTVAGHDFQIVDLLLRPSADAEHAIHFCAHKRVVKSQKIAGAVAHAHDAVEVDGQSALYAGCVTGELLDECVNPQRTDFTFNRDGELSLADGGVMWSEIANAAVKAVREFLAPHLESSKEKSLQRIRDFIEVEEPRYRILLGHAAADLGEIPGNLTDEKLELELHKRLATWRHEAKVQAAKQLTAVPDDPEAFAAYEADVLRALGDLQEVAKADLADYVVHRRAVLDFFETLLGQTDSGKFAREDALHGLFFPLRTTSDSVDYEGHNLWVIDEKLAFHHFLASDLALSAGAQPSSTQGSKKRPDLVIYNNKLAFTAENMGPFSSMVIVEFKRPERDDYTDTENPVTQVYEYIRELRDGRARNPHGGKLDRLPPGVPFFCHILVSLTASLRKQLENMDMVQGPDGQSYFTFNKSMTAYIEVVSYSKALQDAVKRNKAFFDKLGLHTGVRRA